MRHQATAIAPPDRLLTPDEVATWLNISKATLYAWRYLPDDGPRGEGPPGILLSNKLRYKRADVEKWLERQRSVSRKQS